MIFKCVHFISYIGAMVMLVCLQSAEMECFELAITQAQGEKGRFQSTKVQGHELDLPDLLTYRSLQLRCYNLTSID